MLTVRPGGNLSPVDHATLVDRTWNKLGGWSRYHGHGFYCVLVREKKPGGLEHFHVLIHVPSDKKVVFDRTVLRWFGNADDIHIGHAHQRERAMRGGKRGSAIGYLTKQRTPQAAWRTPYRREPGDLVLGKRARISSTLRSYVTMTPPQGEISRGPHRSFRLSPSIQSEAA